MGKGLYSTIETVAGLASVVGITVFVIKMPPGDPKVYALVGAAYALIAALIGANYGISFTKDGKLRVGSKNEDEDGDEESGKQTRFRG